MIIIPPPEITIAEAIKESEENPLWDSMDLAELEEVEEGAEEVRSCKERSRQYYYHRRFILTRRRFVGTTLRMS